MHRLIDQSASFHPGFNPVLADLGVGKLTILLPNVVVSWIGNDWPYPCQKSLFLVWERLTILLPNVVGFWCGKDWPFPCQRSWVLGLKDWPYPCQWSWVFCSYLHHSKAYHLFISKPILTVVFNTITPLNSFMEDIWKTCYNSMFI